MSAASTIEETPDRDGAFPRLTEDQVSRLRGRGRGRRRATQAGEVLFRQGDGRYDFFVVLSGKVAVIDGEGDDTRLIAVHGHGRFLGELGLLTGETAFFSAVVHEPGEVLAVPVEELRDLILRDQPLSDLVLRAYFLRRELLIGLGAGLRIIGSRYSPDSRRVREFVARNRLPHRWLDVEEDRSAEQVLHRLGVEPGETPVVIWRGEVLRNPSNEQLARAVGLAGSGTQHELCDLLVVGAGPAGLAASVYGAADGLDTVTLDALSTGGQAGSSSRIENYLGFPAGISGGELGDRATLQARKFGADVTIPAEAVDFEPREGHCLVRLSNGSELRARTVLVASGARYRKLAVPRLEQFEGVSVFHAATLMEARVCAGDPIAVVGGGNSAGQAVLFLSRYASEARLIVRGDSLARDMSRYLADRIGRSPIEVMLDTEVRELEGDGELRAIITENTRTGEHRRLSARALFVFIGAVPHTGWLGGHVALDPDGFVLTGTAAASAVGRGGALPAAPLSLETSCPGVLAAGDVRSGSIKRVASAVGEGSMAVRLVYELFQRSARQPLHAP